MPTFKKILLSAIAGALGGSAAWAFILTVSSASPGSLLTEMMLGGLAGMFIGGFLWSHESIAGREFKVAMQRAGLGADLSRGLLTFANSRQVTDEGSGWLAIHLANTFGQDKLSFDDRIEWVGERRQMWLDIAAAPLKNRDWLQADGGDKAWRALAAVFEWARFLEEGPDMVSALPLHVDGTCNGIQQLSAMMRDEVGGLAVNLYPQETPRDIYKEVANALQQKLEQIEEGGGKPGAMARSWLEALDRDIPRSLTKRPVMVLPYGGTREAYFKYVYEWLNKHDPEGKKLPKLERRDAVPWLVKHLWDAVSAIVVAGRKCMEWLKKVASVVAECQQPIVWRTPSGFIIRHFYGKVRERRIKTRVDGKTIRLVDYERTKELSKREQMQGIAPNFVHSMDASHLMETVIRFSLDNTKPPITTIHDAYATVAGSMWNLYRNIREAFVAVHTHDVLDEFRQQAVSMYRDYLMATKPLNWAQAMERAVDMIPPPPERGSLDLKAVRNSDYFFA